jgi:hypothetical protein
VQGAGCKEIIANFELRIADLKARSQEGKFGLRIANCEFKSEESGSRRQNSGGKKQKRTSLTYWILATDYRLLFYKYDLNELTTGKR